MHPGVPVRGGPPKFMQPIAGAGKVNVDFNDGADFHAMPFFHPFGADEEKPATGFAGFLFDVLLPLVIGVAAGLTVSGVGFVIGMGVVALWRMMFGKETSEVFVVEGEVDEEKKGLLVEEEQAEEGLPEYKEKEDV